MTDSISLTKMQAFAAMQYLISQYYWLTKADDLGGISSCLMLLSDDSTADPAFAEDWIDSVKVVMSHYSENMLFTSEYAYKIAREFLELYCRIGFSEEVQQLIDRMKLDRGGNICDQEINVLWNKALNLAISNGPMYLRFP